MRHHILLLAILLFLTNVCLAQTSYYWHPSSGSNWSTVANWRTGSYSGTTATAYPGYSGSTDNVYLGDNSTSCTLDVSTSITNLTYESTSSALINTSNSSVLTIIGNITLSNTSTTGGGTAVIKMAGSGTQYIYGSSTSGQSKLPNLTINSSGTIQCSGYITMGGSTTLTYTAGTVNAGTSDFIFYYNNTITGGIELKDIEFQGTNTSYTLTDSLIVDSIATISGSSQVLLNTGKLDLKGNLVVSNTSTYTGGTATINFIGSANCSLTATSAVSLGQGSLPIVKINKTGGTLSLYGNISVIQNWTNNYSATNINPGTSTVFFFYGNNTVNIGGTYATPLWNVVFGSSQNCTYSLNADSALVIENKFTINGSNYVVINGDWMNVRGSLTISNTSIYSGGTAYINFTGSANDSITATSAVTLGEGYLPSVQINKTGGTLSLFGKISVQQGWTNNYTTANINPGTSTLFPFYANYTVNIGGTHPMPVWNLVFGGTYNSTYSINADSAFIINDTFTLTGNHYVTVSGHSLKIKGNIAMTSTYGVGFSVSTVFDIEGSANQTLCGSAALPVQTWVMNKSAGTFTLNEPLTLSSSLTLTKGDIITSSTNLLTLNNGATVSGANDNSFINGPVKKIGNTSFTFPTGYTYYNPIAITAPSSTSDAYTAQYFNTGSTSLSTTLDTSVNYANACEYWSLNYSGSSTVKVSLNWDSYSCLGIATLSTLRIAELVSSTWKSIGSSTTGATSSGSITSTNTLAITTNYFTIDKKAVSVYAHAGSNFSRCSGHTDTLGASPAATGGMTPFTYSWAPSTGLSSSTVANPTVSPTATTTYTLTVSDPDNATAISTITVTVNSNPTASSGSTNNVCTGSNVTIGGSPTASGGTSPYTYQWSPNTALNASTTANPTANPTSTMSYTLTVTDNNGCIGTASLTLTVNSLPTANAGSNSAICSGSNTTIGGSPAATGGTSPYTYQWSPTTALSASTIGQPTSSATTTTTYTLTVTDNNGCVGTSNITLTVNTLPTAHAGSNSAICLGSSATVGGSPAATGGTSPYSYQWAPATALSTSTIGQPTSSATTTTTYTLTVTDNNGCVGSANTILTVNTLPTANVGSNNALCIGSSITIGGSPAATGGTSPYTYQWSPTTALSTSTIGQPTSSASTTTTYTLTVTDNNGCIGTANLTLAVNSLPTANAGSNGAICVGSSTAIGGSPVATGGTSPYIYQWSPSTALSNSTIGQPSSSATTTTTYTLTVTDNNGCVGTSNMILTINPLPTAHAGSNSAICIGSTTTIGGSPAATGGTSPYSYQWSPATALSSGTIAQPTATPSITTTYTLAVTDNNGCVNANSVSVTVHIPIANAGGNQTIFPNTSIAIGGNPAATETAPASYTYQWSPTTGLSSTNMPRPIASPTATTTYTLTVIDNLGCQSTNAMTVNINQSCSQ